MRWTRTQGSLVVVGGALALVVGAWWGLVRGGEVETPSTAGRRVTGDLSEALDRIPGCRVDLCRIVARRGGFGFDGRAATLVVVARPETCRSSFRSSIHLLSAAAVLWSAEGDDLCGDPVGGVTTDATRHAFLALGDATGRTRLVVLAMADEQPEDFGSLAGRFEGGRARDVDDDGVDEILVGNVVYRWTGRDYEVA